MASSQTRFSDQRYLNWLKDSLSLLYLKEGIESFVDTEAVTFHNHIQQTLGTYAAAPQICSSCTPTCMKKDFRRHMWHMACPLCNSWLKQLIKNHINQPLPNLHTENTNPQLWPTDPWEIVKLYMPYGCQGFQSAKDGDVQGILSLFKNCLHFHTCGKIGRMDLIDELLGIRNSLFHSGKFQVEDANLQADMQTMLDFLRGMTSLSPAESQSVQQAVDKIIELQTNTLDLSLNKELELRALQQKQNALDIELQRLDHELRTTTAKACSTEDVVNTMQQGLGLLETNVQTLQQESHSNSARTDMLETNVQTLQQESHSNSARTDMLETNVQTLQQESHSNSARTDMLETNVQTLQQESHSNSARTDMLETNVQTLQQESHSNSARTDMLKTYVQTLQQESHSSSARTDMLETNVQNLQQESHSSSARTDMLETNVQNLQQESHSSSARTDMLETNVQTLQQESHSSSARTDMLETNVQTLQQESHSSSARTDMLETNVQTLQQESHSSSARTDKLETNVQTLQQESHSSSARTDILKTSVHTLQLEVASGAAKATATETDVYTLKGRTENLELKLQRMQGFQKLFKRFLQANDLEQDVARLSTRIEQQGQSIQNQMKRVIDLEVASTQQGDQLSKQGDQLSKQGDQLSKQGDQISNQGDQISNLYLRVESELQSNRYPSKKHGNPQEIAEADIDSLQPALVKHYRQHCLLVPNPVVAEELGLEEVYVSPDIKVLRETKNPRAGLVNVQNRTTPANTSVCKQIFYTEDYKSKQIYITGDAGMGKSIFCKHLVSLWCNTHSDMQSNNSEESDSDDAMSEEEHRSLLRSSSGVQQRKEVKRQTREEDRTVMSDFQLLFYITLRDAVKQYSVAEMIDSQILQLIDCTKPVKASDILQTEGCLVIIDGLDEWVCPENVKVPHFINPGIPGRRGLNSSNVYLTTTRPWKFDVLQLKSSEVDKHVELVGFERMSSKRLCSKIIKLLNRLENVVRTRQEFWAELEKKGLDHFHNVPVILTQLICLWFDKQDLGQSQVQLYCSMLEMLLKRAVKNLSEQNCTATLKSDHTEKLLPQCFSNRPHCQAHQQLLVVLCRVAFEALFDQKRENALVFESSQMTMYGVDQSNIDVCLKSGILSQNKVLGKWSVSEKKMSFLHKKLQEFLAVIFITNCENAENVLKQIKSFCSTVETVLEMSQVWMFVSGIRPDLSRQLMTDLMTHVVLNDGRLQQARQTLTGYPALPFPALLQPIQTCIVDCVVEARSNGHHDFCLPLEDFIIDKNTIPQCLEYLLTSNIAAVKSVYIDTDGITGDDVQTAESILCQLQDTHCLQTLHLSDRCSVITDLKPLCKTLVNNKNSLTCLVLNNIKLTTELSAAMCSTLKHVTTLDLYDFRLTHEQREQLLLSLSQADDIRQLRLWGLICTDHGRPCRPVIDFSGHTRLHTLRLIYKCVENLAAVAHCVQHVELWYVTIAKRQLLQFVLELSSTSHRVTVILYNVTVTGDCENPVDLTHLRHNDKLVVTQCQYIDSDNTWRIGFHTAADDH